jgi:hypothetical protein
MLSTVLSVSVCTVTMPCTVTCWNQSVGKPLESSWFTAEIGSEKLDVECTHTGLDQA